MTATALGGAVLAGFLLVRARAALGAVPLAGFLLVVGLWATGLMFPGGAGEHLMALAPLGASVFVHFAARLTGRCGCLVRWSYAVGGAATLAALANPAGAFVPWAGVNLFRYDGAGLLAAGAPPAAGRHAPGRRPPDRLLSPGNMPVGSSPRRWPAWGNSSATGDWCRRRSDAASRTPWRCCPSAWRSQPRSRSTARRPDRFAGEGGGDALSPLGACVVADSDRGQDARRLAGEIPMGYALGHACRPRRAKFRRFPLELRA